MSPKLHALYTTVRIVLLAFAFSAAFQAHWTLVFWTLVVRSTIWWIALPRRRARDDRTIGEHIVEKNRKTARDHGFADLALTMARLPKWIGVPCRLIMLLPMRAMGDPVANALLLYGRGADPRLVRLTGKDDPDTRENAARALVELRLDSYPEALRPLLADPVDAVRAVAEGGLGGSTDATSDPFLRLVRLPAHEPISDDLVDRLREGFDSASAGEKRAVIEALGRRGGGSAVGWLVELVGSRTAESIHASIALRGVQDPRVADALLTLAESPIGLTALRELVERGDPRTEPIVLRWLQGSGWLMKGTFLGLLAKLPTETAQAEILRRAESGGWLARFFAAEAMAHEGGKPEPLRRLAVSRNPVCRYCAWASLRRLERGTVQTRGS